MQMSRLSGAIPQMWGEPTIRRVEMAVSPSLDESAEPFVRQVAPVEVPTLDASGCHVAPVEPRLSVLSDDAAVLSSRNL